MSYYRVCPRCGAHLDPGEVCADCREKESAAVSADYTGGGRVEQIRTTVSTSIIPENGGFVK